jgi:hypothetical protein
MPAVHTDAIGFAAPPIGNSTPAFDGGIEHPAPTVMRLAEMLETDSPEPRANVALDRASSSASDELSRDQAGVSGEPSEPETRSDLFAGGAPVPSLSLDDDERKSRLRDMFGKVRAKIRRDP